MNHIDIDFAPSSIKRTILRTPLSVIVIMIVGALLIASATTTLFELVQRRASSDVALSKIVFEREAGAARIPLVKGRVVLVSQIRAVNAAAAQLNLPWRDIFDAVEAATPETIALIGLEPDAPKRLIHGIAEAKDSDTMLAYVETLKKQWLLENVVLSKHETNEQDPNKPIRFYFDAHWLDATP